MRKLMLAILVIAFLAPNARAQYYAGGYYFNPQQQYAASLTYQAQANAAMTQMWAQQVYAQQLWNQAVLQSQYQAVQYQQALNQAVLQQATAQVQAEQLQEQEIINYLQFRQGLAATLPGQRRHH
ncbi:MAG: hypothetical protein KGJ06_02630 [Pseudomonadota bacterium]|nr:hypothetical protein [Pseudomonadota bacterium]